MHVVRPDEKTGIQANERTQPTRPMPPGLVERVAFEDIRQGTQTLIAKVEGATGQVSPPCGGPTRTEEDFVGQMKCTIARDPAATWICIGDRLNTQQAESRVRLVAQEWGIDAELGVKGKAGILESMPTRADC